MKRYAPPSSTRGPARQQAGSSKSIRPSFLAALPSAALTCLVLFSNPATATCTHHVSAILNRIGAIPGHSEQPPLAQIHTLLPRCITDAVGKLADRGEQPEHVLDPQVHEIVRRCFTDAGVHHDRDEQSVSSLVRELDARYIREGCPFATPAVAASQSTAPTTMVTVTATEHHTTTATSTQLEVATLAPHNQGTQRRLNELSSINLRCMEANPDMKPLNPACMLKANEKRGTEEQIRLDMAQALPSQTETTFLSTNSRTASSSSKPFNKAVKALLTAAEDVLRLDPQKQPPNHDDKVGSQVYTGLPPFVWFLVLLLSGFVFFYLSLACGAWSRWESPLDEAERRIAEKDQALRELSEKLSEQLSVV